MFKCKVCGKEFEKEFSLERHITTSYGKEKIRKHCPILVYKYKYNGDKRFSKRNLKKMYLVDRKSTPMMSEELNVCKKTLLDTMHFYDIKMRTISEATQNQIERDGLWNKGKTKYNHPSIMKYAKSRVGKNNPYYTAPGFEERQRKMLERHKKWVRTFCTNRDPKTTERRMRKLLDEYGFYYIRNFSLSYYENGRTKWRLFDFLINDGLLIEMNGNYFHANPKMYNEEDEITIHKSKRKAKDIWEYDAKKMQLGKDNGYKTMVIWESDFADMTDKEIISLLNKESL
jgi:hypothetical protein